MAVTLKVYEVNREGGTRVVREEAEVTPLAIPIRPRRTPPAAAPGAREIQHDRTAPLPPRPGTVRDRIGVPDPDSGTWAGPCCLTSTPIPRIHPLEENFMNARLNTPAEASDGKHGGSPAPIKPWAPPPPPPSPDGSGPSRTGE
ncbi:MAG TPA: hypothetical protein VN520_30460 [Streptomyces sp.]|uniref:hypothetical protein n=1 Tax=Streptomyces sp. TaxID=1931 RepID=UPI002C07D8E6|nr:hypothetical protein [Streptomyces sp.]HWU10634.1 hypothetical protein [Streptomyces sp.]